jgi:outer membrane protein OmpA-like peptidoglycan-associated protein
VGHRTSSRRIRAVVVVLAAAIALVLAACKGGPDLTRAKAKAFELLGQYGPRVSGLIGKHADLKTRLAALPADTAGAAEVAQALDAQHATIAKLKAALDGYGATIDKAGKAGGQQGIEQAMNAFAAEVNGGLGEASAGLETAAKKLGELEAAVKAASTPPPVVDVELFLPGGAKVKVPVGGVEQQLFTVLVGTGPLAGADDEAAWLPLDRVTFAPNGDTPGAGAGADAQLEAIAAILRAYPGARLALAGSAAADEAKAESLAKTRADKLLRTLVDKKGAPGKALRVESRPLPPACKPDDEACKAPQRRVAFRVTAR